MPFTPFHMGPALTTKAALGRDFSIPIYGFTQVAIDSEVLAGSSFRGDLSFHKVMHTFAGATAVAALTVLLLGPASGGGIRWWNRSTKAAPRVTAGERDGAADRIDGGRTNERAGAGGVGGAADDNTRNKVMQDTSSKPNPTEERPFAITAERYSAEHVSGTVLGFNFPFQEVRNLPGYTERTTPSLTGSDVVKE